MRLDEEHPDNRLLIEYCRSRKPKALPLAPPESNPHAYLNLGSHPDIVERIWDGLNAHLPQDCRAIVYGSPVLVHPGAGIVIAMGYGTSYVLRVPEAFIGAALALGCTARHTWSGGASTDIAGQFGNGWLFGNWLREEAQWLAATFAQVAKAAPHAPPGSV
jgi:hypothetical protein